MPKISRATTEFRLLLLADFLRTIKPHKFDLCTWAADRARPSYEEDVKLNPHRCKTVACAAGWATCIPEFNDAGFVLVKDVPAIPDRDLYGTNAIAQVLGIPYGVAFGHFIAGYAYDSGLSAGPVEVAEGLESLARRYA